MAIYKDAEKLKKELFERKDAANKCYADASAKGDEEMMVRADAVVGAFIECILTINSLPPADVVEVVRCQNCKWWDNEEPQPFGYCHAAKHCHYSRHWEIQIYRTTEPDFFCKDGERRGDDERT